MDDDEEAFLYSGEMGDETSGSGVERGWRAFFL